MVARIIAFIIMLAAMAASYLLYTEDYLSNSGMWALCIAALLFFFSVVILEEYRLGSERSE